MTTKIALVTGGSSGIGEAERDELCNRSHEDCAKAPSAFRTAQVYSSHERLPQRLTA